jgi:hypothetical protein
MNDEYDYPTQDDHFNGLEEEIHSNDAQRSQEQEIRECKECGELCHIDNLHDGICEDCWDDQHDEPYEDDVWHDADALSSAGYGMDEDYGYYGED